MAIAALKELLARGLIQNDSRLPPRTSRSLRARLRCRKPAAPGGKNHVRYKTPRVHLAARHAAAWPLRVRAATGDRVHRAHLVGAPFRRSCRNRLQLPRSRTAALVSRASRVTVDLRLYFFRIQPT